MVIRVGNNNPHPVNCVRDIAKFICQKITQFTYKTATQNSFSPARQKFLPAQISKGHAKFGYLPRQKRFPLCGSWLTKLTKVFAVTFYYNLSLLTLDVLIIQGLWSSPTAASFRRRRQQQQQQCKPNRFTSSNYKCSSGELSGDSSPSQTQQS